MGRCRLYRPGGADARVLDLLLGHNREGDVRLGTDRVIVCTDDNDVPTGCLVWRPVALIHELHVPPALGQRSVADDLYRSALTLDFNRRHLIRQAWFMVDSFNDRMLRYARDVGATEQSGTIFTLNLEGANEGDGQAGQRASSRRRGILRPAAVAGRGDGH